MKSKTGFAKRLVVVTCALVAAQSALAFYNPSTGRWLSRDPIEEAGGLNSYCFVRNDAIEQQDLLGLIWIVERKWRPRATATSTDGFDTWDDLARLVGMDTKDYKKWVQTQDASPQHCKSYSIPNTVFIDLGKKNLLDRGPFDIISMFHQVGYWTRDYYLQRGFLVQLKKGPTGMEILDHMGSKDIYIYEYLGHGDPASGKINTGGFGATEWVAPGRHTLYGIYQMNLYSCGSVVKLPHDNDNPGTFVQSPWERNVSTRGMLGGFKQSITGWEWIYYGYDLWSRFPGTNN